MRRDDKLSRHAPTTITPYIQDIIQQQKASEKRLAVRLSRLGWTQTEIGEIIGKDRSRLSEGISHFRVNHEIQKDKKRNRRANNSEKRSEFRSENEKRNGKSSQR